MSIIRADSIKNRAGDGAPDFPNGITVTGIVTATTLNQNVTGVSTFADNVNINADLDVSGNISIGGTLTYEDVTNIDSVGMVTARAGLKVTGGTSYFAGAIAAAGAITGTASTATTITVSSDTTDTLCFPVFTNTGVGNNAPKVNTSRLSFNSSTGQLSATSYVGDGSALTGIDATTIQTGNNKVQTSATSISNIIGNAGIATITAQGINVTGIVTATSMKVFASGIDYGWQGGTATAWWRSEDIVNETSWPAAKGGTDANFINGNGGSNGISYISSDSRFNGNKCVSMSSGGTGSLRTTGEAQNQWWSGNEAFTMMMVMRKDAHHSGANLGDSAFAINYNTVSANSNVGGWSFDIFGDHTWGGQYGEVFEYTGALFENNYMNFSYPYIGLLMVRMYESYNNLELSVNGGSGWHPLEMRHNAGSSMPTSNFRSLSILNNACENNSSHNLEGRVAECAWWKGKRLGGNELETVTRHWCEKFNL